MINTCAVLITLVTLASAPADSVHPDTTTLASCFSPLSVFRFAGHLKDQGDYERAAAEYERLLFLGSPDYPRQAVIEQIAGCQVSRGDWAEAARWYRILFNESTASADSVRCAIREIGMLYRGGRYASVEDRCDSLTRFSDVRIAALRSAALLHLNDLGRAKASVAGASVQPGTDSAIVPVMRNWMAEYESLPRKSAAIAGALSTIFPGLGKAYAGRVKDGLFALGITAFFAWQAWDGYKTDGIRSFKGNTCAALGGAFYLSNIYGSVIAVRVYNQQTKDETLKKIDVSVQMQLP